MTIKRIIGVVVLFFLGFITFMYLSGLGYTIAITLTVMNWWQIVAGTVLGTFMVLLLYLVDLGKK